MENIINKNELNKIKSDLVNKTICSINKEIVDATKDGKAWVIIECPSNVTGDILLRLKEAGYEYEMDTGIVIGEITLMTINI